jgi:hypothetical protein
MTQKNQIINYVDDGKLCKINLPENSIALIVPDDFSIIFVTTAFKDTTKVDLEVALETDL